MTTFTYTSKGSYSEIGQPNPIRWAILSGNPIDGFVNESSWLKCKDFFNDYVVAYNGGKRFSIYSFSTVPMTIPTKGEHVYMAVKDLTPQFADNLEVLNRGLPEVIEHNNQHDGVLILEIPSFYFENTYNISLLTLMIRLCNIPHQFTTYKEFVEYKEHSSQDQNLWNVVVKKDVFFCLPEQLQQYVWYEGPQYNSKDFNGQDYQLPSLCHNNGVVAWSRFF